MNRKQVNNKIRRGVLSTYTYEDFIWEYEHGTWRVHDLNLLFYDVNIWGLVNRYFLNRIFTFINYDYSLFTESKHCPEIRKDFLKIKHLFTSKCTFYIHTIPNGVGCFSMKHF